MSETCTIPHGCVMDLGFISTPLVRPSFVPRVAICHSQDPFKQTPVYRQRLDSTIDEFAVNLMMVAKCLTPSDGSKSLFLPETYPFIERWFQSLAFQFGFTGIYYETSLSGKDYPGLFALTAKALKEDKTYLGGSTR